jgi:3-methyladenine DNA glycosylase AlkD
VRSLAGKSSVELWDTGDTAARLLALLICRPKTFERDELDAMVRETLAPKVRDWFVNYVVKKSPPLGNVTGGVVRRSGSDGRQCWLGAHR